MMTHMLHRVSCQTMRLSLLSSITARYASRPDVEGIICDRCDKVWHFDCFETVSDVDLVGCFDNDSG